MSLENDLRSMHQVRRICASNTTKQSLIELLAKDPKGAIISDGRVENEIQSV
jgi:hypothetical protein